MPARHVSDFQTLCIREEDIRPHHVLALFTPPPDMAGRGRIITKVQYILSQVEPFNLQKFIRFIDEDKWTEEGEKFMASVRSVLDALISDQDPFLEPFQTGMAVLIDLSDSTLLTPQTDAVLISIILEKVWHNRLFPSTIVFDACQDYIKTNSILTKTVQNHLQANASSPVSMLFTTNDPIAFPQSLLQWMDFVISGMVSSPNWKILLDDYFVKDSGKGIDDLTSGQIGIISSHSRRISSGNHRTLWGPKAVTMSYSDIIPPCYTVSEILAPPAPLSPSTLLFTPERFPQRFTPLTRAILVITEGKCGVPVHGGKINTLCGGPKALKAWGWSSLETLLTAAVRYGLIDTMIQKDQLLVTLHPPRYMENKAASEIDDHTAGSPARSPPERLKVASKYLPIVVSILNKSDNRFEFPVHAEPVAQDLGGNKRCRALGWSSYGVYEDVAAKQGYVAITSLGKGSSRLLAAKTVDVYFPLCVALYRMKQKHRRLVFTLKEVNSELLQSFPEAFKDAGCETLTEYIIVAETEGIVKIVFKVHTLFVTSLV